MRLFSVALLLPLVGCVSGSYTPPPSADITKSIVVDSSFDETWDRLISYTAASFFGIDNFEKESGLLTLTFGSGDAVNFIDCGTFSASAGAKTYNGPYVSFMEQQNNATLTGRMNLRAVADGSEQTRVIVNARYVFSSPSYVVGSGAFATRIPAVTWSFESATSDTTTVPNSADKQNTTRTCRSTGAAEKAILDAVRQ